MKLSENIKQLRKNRNMRQEQLAEAMGVSTASVSKWETGQCAPELTVLMELADFFEVSIDFLMGHSVDPDRVNDLLKQAERAVDARDENTAVALCERILRNYPNDAHAVKACADSYYRLSILTGRQGFMQRCVELTRRLMGLNQGEPERDRLERIRDLGNQYALLEQWDQAREHYEKSNVGRCNQAAIAQCLLRQEKYQEAIGMLSDELTRSVFHIYQSVNTLTESWGALGEYGKACAALTWVYNMMEDLHFNPTIRMLVQIALAANYQSGGQPEQALEAIGKAAQLTRVLETGMDFLQLEKEPEFLLSTADDVALLMDVAQKMGTAYVDAVREVLE